MTTDIIAAAEAAQSPVEDDALTPPGWHAKDTSDCEFAFQCMNESQAEIDAIDASLRAFVAAAQARRDRIVDRAQKRIAYFTSRLVEYAETHKSELLTGKRKSRDLLAGSFVWRKKGGKLVVTDRPALVEWLQTQDPALYRVKIEPEMRALQELCAKTGVVPPGTDFEPERDELTVVPSPLPTLAGSPTKEIA